MFHHQLPDRRPPVYDYNYPVVDAAQPPPAVVHAVAHLPPSLSAPAPTAPPPSAHAPQATPAVANARRHTTAAIGSPITFYTGPFAGRTVRAEIKEVQKADLGRKCADPPTATASPTSASPSNANNSNNASGNEGAADANESARSVRKDRRPLDPPPVVSLKYYEVFHHGTDRQHEREIPAE